MTEKNKKMKKKHIFFKKICRNEKKVVILQTFFGSRYKQ